jgi:diguanylate cyclase (GGDEF)-like protein/PAS domain S-box-containing protein
VSFVAWPSFTLFPLHLLVCHALMRATPRSMVHRLLALVSLLLGLWALAHGLYVLAPDESTAWFYHGVATAVWLALPAVIFHCLLELTDAWSIPRQRRSLLVLLYAPVVVLFARLIYAGELLDKSITKGRFGWYEQGSLGSAWAIASLVLWCGGGIASLGLVQRWRHFSIRRVEKAQARIIVLSGILSLAVSVAYTAVLPAVVGDCQFSTRSPLATAVWFFIMWHAIVHPPLLGVSPAVAVEDILQMMTEPLVLADGEQRIVRVNTAFEQLFGVEAGAMVRRPVGYALSGSSVAPQEWRRRLDQGDLDGLEMQFQRPDGEEFTLVISATRVGDAHGDSSGFVVVMRDVTALKAAEEGLSQAGTHDPLTRLPNRLLLKDRAEQAFARSRRTHTSGAVLLLDLDGFKAINDVHGHEGGDEILRQVAARCKRTLRETDTVARLGGDEFVALVTDLQRCEDAKTVVQRLERALLQPFLVGKQTLTLGVSIGVSLFPEQGEDLQMLMTIAEDAMCTAKQGAKVVESSVLQQTSPLVPDTRILAGALALALHRKEFELWYQPLHDASDGRILGAEALLRWRHPDYGTIGPSQFLPLAEQSGLIVPIGTWALRMACIQNKAWQAEGLPSIPVAVGVSVRQLVRGDFAQSVYNLLEECELDSKWLQIEISEMAALHDLPAIRDALIALNNLGVRIVVDDFGAGHTALSQLRNLSVYAIKIGQLLTRNMIHDPRDAAIVRAIVSMANAFGIRTIAKGIESEGQLEFLQSLRREPCKVAACEMVQGLVFSRPTPALEVGSLLGRAPRSE